MKKFLPGSLMILYVLISCSKGGSGADDGGNNGGNNGGGGTTINCTNAAKLFSANVNPLIQTFCNQTACHNAGSINGPGPLTNYSQVFAAKTLIRSAIASGAMPQNTTLTTAQQNTIICWIDAGAANN